ncbi:hypothetical protein [uncultured Winogradskyella sp.]|uniref:hypothetical protein n=1 Tax=uncultured Winogradskyella sp. TaxID=395353 RepID=UPI0030DB6D17|tara:strand:- start:632 stop:1216 length:585 start_codon:yes stop_codon:yes gene_type:complete
MRILLGVLIILVIGFTSCEGRKTQSRALAESIEEFKKSATLEIDVYHPKTYVEREIDTLLSNGYRIKIKAYSDMENSVLLTKIKDTINYQIYYRNYKFNILVEKEGKLIYNENFDKLKANIALDYRANYTSDSQLYNFDKLAVLKSIQVNNDLSLSNIVAIDIMFAIPETNKYTSHRLFINEKGKSNFVQIEVK